MGEHENTNQIAFINTTLKIIRFPCLVMDKFKLDLGIADLIFLYPEYMLYHEPVAWV